MAKNNRTLVLFSRWFPYNKQKEFSFLFEELSFLKKAFNRVILVPQKIEGEKHKCLEGIQVDESLAKRLEKVDMTVKLKTLLSFLFMKELVRIGFHKNKTKYAIASMVSGIITKDWILQKFRSENDVVLYSFWLDHSALGSTLASRFKNNFKTLARCHNFDLYGNEANNYYVPFQKFILDKLNAIYPDSVAGEEYIKSQFSGDNCKAQIMGVDNPNYRNPGSVDGTIRIVSCSYMIPRKRVPLMAKGLIESANRFSAQKIEWTHIGDGEQRGLIDGILIGKPNNLMVTLPGSMSNEQLQEFYRKNPIDLFINVSEKEGTPVSLMEAISFSIPVLVSGFGGNLEVARRGGGIALSENPSPEEIAIGIDEIINSENRFGLKQSAFEAWDNHYNCQRNYEIFCEDLAKL